jgi:hypothetical protein
MEMNMAKSNETKMNGIETLVHHSNPSNKPLNIDPKFKKLFDDIKKPKIGNKQYSMVMTMLNGKPISINDIVEWYKIIEPTKIVSKSNHTQHFVNVKNLIEPHGFTIATNIDKTKIIVEMQ